MPAGERGALRTFDDEDLGAANARARALFLALRGHTDLEDVILGARSVLALVRAGHESPSLPVDGDPPGDASGRSHELDVDYDGEDLQDVATETGLSVDDVVGMHSGATYTVAFVGFAPGFGYLLGLPAALQVPRLRTPRTRVPAGSVAIAGPFSAVYPAATPGGWRLIGRTDATMFDEGAVLQPGDTVRFRAR